MVSFLIVFVSFVLRKIFIMLMDKTGESRNSTKAIGTMYSILMVTFFVNGILFLIAPWSFSEQGVEDGDFLSGIYTDFTATWFKDIGALIAETMAINLAAPSIEAFCFYLLRLLGRALDQRSLCPKQNFDKNSSDYP